MFLSQWMAVPPPTPPPPSFSPGARVQDEIRATLGKPVSSLSDSFLLVAAFGRCKFRLTESSVGLILQATIAARSPVSKCLLWVIVCSSSLWPPRKRACSFGVCFALNVTNTKFPSIYGVMEDLTGVVNLLNSWMRNATLGTLRLPSSRRRLHRRAGLHMPR